MSSALATLLQLVVSLLLLIQNNPSIPASQQQQVLNVTTQAIQLAGQTPAQAPSAPTGSDVYKDQTAGIVFQYPSTDVLSEDSDLSVSYFFVNPPPDFNFIASVALSSSTYQYDPTDPTDQSLVRVNRAIEIYQDGTSDGLQNCQTDQAEASTSEGPILLPGMDNIASLFPQTTTIGEVPFYLYAGTGAPGMGHPIVYGIGYKTLHDGNCFEIYYLSQQWVDTISTGTGYPVMPDPNPDEQAGVNAYFQVLKSFEFTK